MTAIRRHQQLLEGGIRDKEARKGMTTWRNKGEGLKGDGGEKWLKRGVAWWKAVSAGVREMRSVASDGHHAPWATLALH